MKPTGKQSRGRAAEVQRAKPRSPGWHTTDAEEIERRRLRGVEEPIRIEALEPDQPHYGSFLTRSGSGAAYAVEIRSLDERLNSCECPDYQVNQLGTCKHIEGVLFQLNRADSLPRSRLDRFFSSDGSLLAEPLTALPALRRAVAELSEEQRDAVRISRHLEPWLEERRRAAERVQTREDFLRDVDQGKRSLDFLKITLYPYQQQGMLHLAFTERALLADEMGLGKTVQAVAACELLRRLRGVQRVLVIAPASLKAEWEEQIAKFTELSSLIIQGTRPARLQQYRQPAFFYLANYEQILSDGRDIQTLLERDKSGKNLKHGGRDRKDETLFIDARKLGTMQTRTLRVLTGGDDGESMLADGMGDTNFNSDLGRIVYAFTPVARQSEATTCPRPTDYPQLRSEFWKCPTA